MRTSRAIIELRLFHGVFPGLTAELLGAVNQVLPGSDGIDKKKVKGKDSSSFLSPSILTALNDRAAIRNNEIVTKKAEPARQTNS